MSTKTPKLTYQLFPFLGMLLTAMLLDLSSSAQSSTADTRGFVNNVVEVGVSEFGFVTAEDSASIYFVIIRHTGNERNYPAEFTPQTFRNAKFYNGSYRAKATKVREAKMDVFSLALYSAPKPAETKWKANYYYTLDDKKGKLSTFRDKWVSDEIWFMHNAKIEVQKKAKSGIYSLKVTKDAGLARGMPLINDQGYIAGIIAESSLGASNVRAISMDDVTEMLYLLGNNDCRYMHMVQMGQNATRCVLEEIARKEAEEKAAAEAAEKERLAKLKEDKNQQPKAPEKKPAKDTAIAVAVAKDTIKRHLIDFGISASLLGGPKQVDMPGEISYFKTKTFHAGIDLYLNLDRKKGRYRVTLKPGFGSFSEENTPSLWSSGGQDVKIYKSGYKFIEMPVLLERQLFGNKKFSTALGVGYAPGYVFGKQYTWTDKDAAQGFQTKVSGSAIQHRLLAEFYFYQCKIGRLGLLYAKDMTAYPFKEYSLEVNGDSYQPFADRKKGWYLGLELAIRLRGIWGK
ncbi:hypothetical protein LZZ85_21490 [Terrimonas sp. NA20]|uniref:DUF3575 domain-containing protein n=1 Tax=Terrimonas ginsenosidimutans TaxID=2908004 RepID=A0ABS9KX49_9BACT|nr:hypothetical protein [Terrimonas ginsenosidimutans]MCG2616885.1 hypothetical protein [Terrimonas ginsenosidimutans]